MPFPRNKKVWSFQERYLCIRVGYHRCCCYRNKAFVLLLHKKYRIEKCHWIRKINNFEIERYDFFFSRISGSAHIPILIGDACSMRKINQTDPSFAYLSIHICCFVSLKKCHEWMTNDQNKNIPILISI